MKPFDPGRPRSFDYVGLNYYSLTWVCHKRQSLFTQADRVEFVRAQFLRAETETDIASVADCFMPDHVHKLVKGQSLTADAKRFIRRAKQYSGFHFSKAFGVRLWQRDGYDRILLGDSEPMQVVRYIIENPVRAGLVEKVEDYPFTGSSLYSIKELIEWAYTI